MGIRRLTLPKGQYLPPEPPQFSQVGSVALHVPFQLVLPKCGILLGSGTAEFARVSVPKTPVNENYLLLAGEYHVRGPGQASFVQDVSIPQPVSKGPDQHFGARVLTPNP